MRVWQLVDGRSLGGIERHVATLVTALVTRGYEAEAVLWRGYSASPWRDQLTADNIPHRVLGGTVSSLVQALRRDRPALVHTHGYKANLIGRLASRALSIPAVCSFHSGERGTFPVSLYQQLDEAFSWLSPSIAVSDEIARRLHSRAHVVRNFLNVPVHVPSAALPRRVGFIGRLSYEKGPDLFCAIARLARPDIEWHVWGDGPMRAELEAQHGNRVVFHGLTLDVSKALDSIGLLAMPSRAEGLPMAALEALAAGVPVLASRVGGLPDIVEHDRTGWLFDAGDIAAGAELVDRWSGLEPTAMPTLRASCHGLVRDRYSDTAVLPQLIAIYEAAGLATRRTTNTAESRGASVSRA